MRSLVIRLTDASTTSAASTTPSRIGSTQPSLDARSKCRQVRLIAARELSPARRPTPSAHTDE
jgi:hypothetical protein